jgi:Aminotransferase class I and II
MDISRTVYSIYYPETRAVVDELWAERPHALYERNYSKHQDALHHGCLDGWRAWAAAAGVTLGSGFPFHYPTAGASEAIHALMAFQATHGGGRVHVFDGEYEGYAHTAAALGLGVVSHSRDPDVRARSLADSARAGDVFWLSQPSAIDGNLWRDFTPYVERLAAVAPGVALIVDLTYVGAVAAPLPIDLDRPEVTAVTWSLSKPFGVYYHRIGGLLTRAEVPSLRGHLWFKNLFSLQLGERLMARYRPGELAARYRQRQHEALEHAREAGLIDGAAGPSDVVMLAHGAAGDPRFAEYRRGAGLRFCLSPLMDRLIQPAAATGVSP